MPGDLIVSDAAIAAAPKDTIIPAASRYIIKQVQALYTDNGAGGAWLPTLEIVSDAGIVTGRYVGTSVAAGSGQEVTFHPLGSKGAAATPAAAVNLPLAQASDFDTTILSGATVTMNLNDWFGTTDASVFGTQVVAGKTYLQVKQSGMYRAYACCIASDLVDTGPLVLAWFWNFGTGVVDVTELDAGQQIIAQVASGGLNRWLVTSLTYFGIDHPGSTAVTIKIAGAGLTGNLSTQHTDIILVREGDYVANVLL